jgi:hypothetical protein
MSKELEWSQLVSGIRLESLKNDEKLDAPGIYIWRRIWPSKPRVAQDSNKFIKWIIGGVSPIYKSGRVDVKKSDLKNKVTIRPKFLSIENLVIGGGKIRDKYQEKLKEMKFEERKVFYNCIKGAGNQFGPVLYVGEASILRNRINDHLNKTSGFSERLSELGLDISQDVGCSYFILPKEYKDDEHKRRLILEEILTYGLSTPLTMKPGE